MRGLAIERFQIWSIRLNWLVIDKERLGNVEVPDEEVDGMSEARGYIHRVMSFPSGAVTHLPQVWLPTGIVSLLVIYKLPYLGSGPMSARQRPRQNRHRVARRARIEWS